MYNIEDFYNRVPARNREGIRGWVVDVREGRCLFAAPSTSPFTVTFVTASGYLEYWAPELVTLI